jgi:enoyl-CoA hydratase
VALLQVDKADGVALLTLNDPGRRNMLSAPLCEALIDAVADANADPGIHAIIVAATPPAFCAGANLSDLEAAAQGDDRAVQTVYRSFMAVAESPLPTIAAVDGAAIGAGFNLALACDMRIAGERARFDTRFLKIGLHPGGGHGWMLLRAVGCAKASRLILAGQSLDAVEALAIGLVESVHPGEALLAEARALAAPMAATPRELLLRTKASLRLAERSTHGEAFAHETSEQAWSLGQPAFADLLAGAKKSPSR